MRGLSLKDDSRDTELLSNYEVEKLAEVEHNRWNVEKLLMGYRKSHPEEDPYSIKDEADKKQLGKNKKLFMHHDIRPYDDLGIIKELDKEFTRYIPWIIRMTED